MCLAGRVWGIGLDEVDCHCDRALHLQAVTDTRTMMNVLVYLQRYNIREKGNVTTLGWLSTRCWMSSFGQADITIQIRSGICHT